MNNINVLIDEKSLHQKIKELANEISNDYQNEEIILICILKGSVYFATALSQEIKDSSIILDFMKVSSYGSSTESTGNIDFKLDLSENIENRNVIIVEDIIDSGITLHHLRELLSKRNPKSLKICTLLDKPERRKKDVKVDYVGFQIENKFVVGYGMDYDEKYRNLPYIGYIERM